MKTNLISARKACALTQGDIARSLHLAVTTVFKWERGIAPVARKHWKTLASLLHVTEEELEEALVQTMLEACITRNDIKPLLNAQTSKLYRTELIWGALEQFRAHSMQSPSVYPENPRAAKEQPVDLEREKLEFERALLERDKRIFELEKQVEELRRELESVRRPHASISSALNIEPIKHEVNHE